MSEYEDKTLCMYGYKAMTVSEYRQKRGVKEFEQRLKELALQSAYCRSDKTSVLDDKLYPVFREGFPTHQNRRCMYFEKYVLPMDKQVESDYWSIFQGGKVGAGEMKDACKRCKQQFTKQAKNQVYCTECRAYNDKEKKRRYYHRTKETNQ